jgi:hypothetical protein
MGELALYLLAQAVGTLGFAYALGTVAFKQRAPPAVMAAAGLYALMGAALVEVGADRFGWSATSLGLDYALVTIGVAAVGSGSFLKNLDTGRGWTRERLVAIAVLAAAVVCGLALITLAGSSEALVDPAGLGVKGSTDGYSHLKLAGRATGAPLLLAGAMMVLAGSTGVLKRRDLGAIWLWIGGVLFMLWPFDLRVISMPLMPALLLLGAACTYFGFHPKGPKAETGGLGADGSKSARGPGPADSAPAAAPAEESPSPK